MNRLLITIVGGVTSLIATGAASAAPPAWCKGASVASGDLRGLSSKEPREVIRTFVAAECAPTPEVEAHRGEIETARQAWSRRLGMTEADWADAVAYAAVQNDYSIAAEATAKTLAQASPLDQYAVIRKAGESLTEFDAIYAADMFEPNLSEAGRLAFLQTTCFNNGQPASVDSHGMTRTEVAWGLCQADLERIDLGKLAGEIRSDTGHDGAVKMKLRIAAYELPHDIKDHAAEVQQMMQRDDANKKLFELAAAARGAWAEGVGKSTKLLDLVLAMDSAAFFQSRKQLEGCAETTAAALAEAASTVPAKAFTGMRDERDDPTGGFATKAGLVLAASPQVNLAAIAFARCTPAGELSVFLQAMLAEGPPLRGPRNAALARIKAAKLTYDKVGAALTFPRTRPYGEGYLDGGLQVHSVGGVVKTVKHAGELLTVELQQTLVKQQDCVRSHATGKISRIRGDGRVEYEERCDRSEVRTHDHTWTPFSVFAKYAVWLKPGVVFSATGKDVIAVWPNATAKTPSMIFGGAVK